MKKVTGILIVTLVVGVITVGVGWGWIPSQISFQGRITDASGNPISGQQSLSFKFYGSSHPEVADSEAVVLWTGGPFAINANSNGVFDVLLVGGTPDLSTLPFDQQYELQMIRNGVAMNKQKFTSVPYAFRAALADRAAVADRVTQWATSGDDINNTNAGAVGITDLRAYPYTAGSATAGVKDNNIRIKAENYTNQFLLLRSMGTDHAGSAGLQFSDRGYDHFWIYNPAKTGDATLRIAYKHYGDQTENPPLSAGADILTIAGNTGNVGIGTTSPSSKLHVYNKYPTSGTTIQYAAYIESDGSNQRAYGLKIKAGSETDTCEFIDFVDGRGYSKGNIRFNGEATIFSGTSDLRQKKDIQDTRLGLDQLMAIKVKDYRLKGEQAGAKLHNGFIAQELYEVYPAAVGKPDDPNEMWTVDYGRLTPLLVKAVQDLKAENESLRSEIEALKQKIR